MRYTVILEAFARWMPLSLIVLMPAKILYFSSLEKESIVPPSLKRTIKETYFLVLHYCKIHFFLLL